MSGGRVRSADLHDSTRFAGPGAEPERAHRGRPGTAITGPALRQFMRSWPGGVAVVTSALDGRTAGCTVNSFISVSLRPPLLLVSLARSSRTLATIIATGVFGVNVLAGHQRELAEQFATGAGDKFATIPYRWECGTPLLAETSAAAICGVERVIDAADHALLLGQPFWCSSVDGVDPLIFAGHSYWTLAR
jgi:3-hydroxy-9,10-secoandrosta-1,3,5(10)-triene-9,17-dione monooxygenase reductase component